MSHSSRRSAGVTLLTDDGVRIRAAHGAARDGGRDLCFVVAHGFSGSLTRPAVRRVTGRLPSYGGVVTFDFRGHGRSGGLSTVGDLEVLDTEAAVRWARLLGYARVATVGFSMGGTIVVRHGGLLGAPQRSPYGGVDAVVAVSAVSQWYFRGTAPMRRLHRAFRVPPGRAVLRHGYRTRVDPRHWVESRPDTWPEDPAAVAGRIAPVPLLVVHGDSDAYFPVEQAQTLYDAARDPRELWIERGFGHAENAVGPELLDRIARWALDATGDIAGRRPLLAS